MLILKQEEQRLSEMCEIVRGDGPKNNMDRLQSSIDSEGKKCVAFKVSSGHTRAIVTLMSNSPLWCGQ